MLLEERQQLKTDIEDQLDEVTGEEQSGLYSAFDVNTSGS